MRLYLSGPMTGLPDMNAPAFARAAAALGERGHEVFNPADKTAELAGEGGDRRRALAVDLTWLCEHAEGVVVLEGWQRSRGACAEFAVAGALDIPVWRIKWFLALGIGAARIRSRAAF